MKSVEDNSSYSGGFTLVELLVVITIIAIMMAALGVGLSSAFETSNVKATESLIRQLDAALENYERDFNEVPNSNPYTFTVDEVTDYEPPQGHTYEDSAILHAIALGEFRRVARRDPIDEEETYEMVGPYAKDIGSEYIDGNRGDYSASIVDAWRNELEVRIPGGDHTGNACPNGSRNNEEWIDIYSLGADFQTGTEADRDGCDPDDINNFSSF